MSNEKRGPFLGGMWVPDGCEDVEWVPENGRQVTSGNSKPESTRKPITVGRLRQRQRAKQRRANQRRAR